MIFVEGQAPVLTLSTVEERYAAYAAVHMVHGEDHALLQPHQGSNLFTGIENPDDVTFEGEEAAIIKGSLEAIAQAKPAPLNQDTARMMLGMPLLHRQPMPESQNPQVLDTAPERPVPEQAPRREQGEIVEGHIMLVGFGQLLTASRALEDFAEIKDQKELAERLRRDIDTAPSLEIEPRVYWGDKAFMIYKALVRAAERHADPGRESTLYDEEAAHMLRPRQGDEQGAEQPTALYAIV